jgi:hypothetical protein
VKVAAEDQVSVREAVAVLEADSALRREGKPGPFAETILANAKAIIEQGTASMAPIINARTSRQDWPENVIPISRSR